jgi:predicted nucleotidyltransferase
MTIQNEAQVCTNRPHSRDRRVAQGLKTDLSDSDILVDTTSETTLFDLGAIRYKLRKLLGVPVDVITPGALPDSFRQTVIAQAQPI